MGNYSIQKILLYLMRKILYSSLYLNPAALLKILKISAWYQYLKDEYYWHAILVLIRASNSITWSWYKLSIASLSTFMACFAHLCSFQRYLKRHNSFVWKLGHKVTINCIQFSVLCSITAQVCILSFDELRAVVSRTQLDFCGFQLFFDLLAMGDSSSSSGTDHKRYHFGW